MNIEKRIKIIPQKGEEDLLFWKKKSEKDRIEAVEFLRNQYYIFLGYETPPRLIRSIHLRRLSK